jgi:hypothetical protein
LLWQPKKRSKANWVSASPLIDHVAERGAEKAGKIRAEVVLQRLNVLTKDEVRAASAQTLDIVYHLLQNISVVMEGE